MHIGGLGVELGLVGIVLLAGNGAAGEQVGPSPGGDLRERLVGAALLETGAGLLDGGASLQHGRARLLNLLIEFGRFDLG